MAVDGAAGSKAFDSSLYGAPTVAAAGSAYAACRQHAAWKLRETFALSYIRGGEEEAVSRLLHEGTVGGGLTRGGAWALRAVDAASREELAAARAENASAERLAKFMTRTKELPTDGHGNWYGCEELPRDLTREELVHFVELARRCIGGAWVSHCRSLADERHARACKCVPRHPNDVKAQITACMAMVRAALVPLHLDASSRNSARIGIAAREGLDVIVSAMRAHRTSELLQCRACEALWRISETSSGARAMDTAGALELVVAAMIGCRMLEKLQFTGISALANIAKHRAEPSSGAFMLESIDAVASAMGNFPQNVQLQRHACVFLWRLATDSPEAVANHAGLRFLVAHAANGGAREAQLLLENVNWRCAPDLHASRGAGRQRWGQWAAGRRARD